jgi:hypothetical protein
VTGSAFPAKPEGGLARYLWCKATTPDDWSRGGEPHPWWDRSSMAPMLSFPRFDLSESSYAFLLLARKTPAWREVYTRILYELLRRHTTWWAAVDWLTQIGPDPDRARYPRRYKPLIPKDLWGHYDVPGWTANGIAPWGWPTRSADGNLFFRGFFTLMLAITARCRASQPGQALRGDRSRRLTAWTHRGIANTSATRATVPGPHCENTKMAVLPVGGGTACSSPMHPGRAPLGLRPLGRRGVQKKFAGFDQRVG